MAGRTSPACRTCLASLKFIFMTQIIYDKFLSSGFAEINVRNSRHSISLYRHNYKRFLPKDRSAKILDVGCGLGQFLEFLGQEGYENFLGVDISSEAIHFCQEKGIPKVQLISDLKSFLLTSGSFDLIVLNDVIEHLPKVEILPILESLHEKLNAGGCLIVKTGNLASLVGARMRYNDFTHETGFTEYSLTQVLKIARFKDIMILPFVFPKNRLIRVVRWLGQKLIHGLWKLVYFGEFALVPKVVDELFFAVGKKE